MDSDRPATSETKYTGVRRRKWGKWVSEIRLPNSRDRIWLGSYDSPEKAARAFDAALYCLRGRHAKFNFPDDPPEIVGGQSLTTQQIQVEAAKFANSYCSVNEVVMPDMIADSVSGLGSVNKDRNMDWSFLEKLDSIDEGGCGSSSNYNSLFSDHYNDHMIITNELFESHDHESKLPETGNGDYEMDYGDYSSNHFFLWNFDNH